MLITLTDKTDIANRLLFAAKDAAQFEMVLTEFDNLPTLPRIKATEFAACRVFIDLRAFDDKPNRELLREVYNVAQKHEFVTDNQN